jgi:hypothetical protein
MKSHTTLVLQTAQPADATIDHDQAFIILDVATYRSFVPAPFTFSKKVGLLSRSSALYHVAGFVKRVVVHKWEGMCRGMRKTEHNDFMA